ncbi:hypothetical protein GOODEAATRI_011140 [Goodea atripinnis]|uniref:Uncharacterized protein n=1 Tax=Goodea atripinnis TaxID=208336 RepID=A0ABV0NCY1_9TELE
MHSVLGWGSFCLNYSINAVRHGGDQPVVLLRCNEMPGCCDSCLQVSCIIGSGFPYLPLDNTPKILYGVQIRPAYWSIKHSSTMVIGSAFGSFGSAFMYLNCTQHFCNIQL